MNIHWPSTPENTLVPWYSVLRRALFSPVVYTGVAIAFVGLTLGWGVDTAKEFCRQVLR